MPSDQGKIPGAPATSPGGMSQQALVDELLTKHGWEEGEVADWRRGKGWDLKAWNAMIDCVIRARRDREQEKRAEQKAWEHTRDAVLHYGGGPGKIADILAEDTSMERELAEMREAYEQAKAEQRALSLLQIDPDTLDYIFDGHSGAGPSGSHRWLHCTASLGASRKFLETLTPNQQREYAHSSMAARQGTTAHSVGEIEAHVLLGDIDRAEADAALLELAIMPEDGVEYDEEMKDYVGEYVELIETYVAERGSDYVGIEARVSAVIPLSGLHEGEVYEIKGSADCVVLPTDDYPDLVVADLKYGNGLDVSVDGNPQIRIYALGVLDSLVDEDGNLTTDVDRITYYIAQPRLGGIKSWSESLDDLLDWRDEVLSPGLTAALYGEAEGATYAPEEEACQFCPARGACSALAEVRIEEAAELFDAIAEAEFDGAEFPETIPMLEDARLGEMLTQIKGVVKIYDDLKAEAQRRLYRGGEVPGWQLVNYTPPRKWDESAAQRLANSDKLWKRTMVTPTQALAIYKGNEKAVEKLERLIIAPDKVPVVAPVGDRRKTWEGKPPEAMFNDEGEEA